LGIVTACFLATTAVAQQPVVVELFTSEGCSSCPPADALLGTLSQHRALGDAEVILLGEHVDYWDGQGWKDRFSSSEFTQRQNVYVKQLHLATPYTPQIVVDGRLQGSGGNGGNVQHLIEESAHSAKPATVTLNLVSPEKLQVIVADSTGTKLQVLFAVTEDNLTTSVRGGENGGRILKHAAVVHELRPLGNTSNGKFEKTISLPEKSDWKKEDLRAVVLVQNTSSGQILGAADIPYVGSHPAPATGR
jgi:hypothetical protein